MLYGLHKRMQKLKSLEINRAKGRVPGSYSTQDRTKAQVNILSDLRFHSEDL